MFNVKSRPYDESWVSHFDPWAPIFSKRQRLEIVVSDVALAVVMCGLYVAGEAMGWVWMAKTYVVPYLIVNFWLVMITLLQHTHPNLPHYTDAEWDWMRGALATVDRNYGWLLNTLHHHIGMCIWTSPPARPPDRLTPHCSLVRQPIPTSSTICSRRCLTTTPKRQPRPSSRSSEVTTWRTTDSSSAHCGRTTPSAVTSPRR